MGSYLWAFLIGGAICAIAQVILDSTPLTPAHVLTGLVVVGGILSAFGWYQPLVELAGAGATVPITSFGHSLVQGAILEAEASGLIGALTGVFEMTSAGITAAIIFAFLVALVANPKG